MAATNNISIMAELTGLGFDERFAKSFSTTTTITAKQHTYQVQATADTAEALELGNVTTPELILIYCVSNDVDIDTSFSTSFSAEITVNEGEFAIFKPTGTVYIKNDDSSEQVTIEAYIWGT